MADFLRHDRKIFHHTYRIGNQHYANSSASLRFRKTCARFQVFFCVRRTDSFLWKALLRYERYGRRLRRTVCAMLARSASRREVAERVVACPRHFFGELVFLDCPQTLNRKCPAASPAWQPIGGHSIGEEHRANLTDHSVEPCIFEGHRLSVDLLPDDANAGVTRYLRRTGSSISSPHGIQVLRWVVPSPPRCATREPELPAARNAASPQPSSARCAAAPRSSLRSATLPPDTTSPSCLVG